MRYPKSRYSFTILLILLMFSACSPNLHETTLPVAQLNESYEFALYGQDNDLWDNGSLVYEKTGGSLPNGVYVTTGGLIAGTPTELGNYEFKVTLYDIDRGIDDDVDSDSEWYTLFVTEPSSNEDCPEPADLNATGISLCLGNLTSTEVLADDELSLDVNLFLQKTRASDYDIDYIDLTITLTEGYFYFDDSSINSNILREATTRAEGLLSYEIVADNQLRLQLSKGNKTFHKSGRLMDLPFFALSDLEEGTYDFIITVHELHSEDPDQSLPQAFEIDGSLVVATE